ncbi:hypothetical protein RFI_35396 [Reticulomyxa filosa]|uniref:Uncharacterized protein n=1 Tax=Reticulomyxa filosa TaxID=46433 RepID=X6LMT8_RETFI|nr:hypothetical protein RFI_35396 [Reticulomyxa filosa]|eukprot:ETO02040.1 hypothetical protein RFI_35396 [Reticulomyxa filosa]
MCFHIYHFLISTQTKIILSYSQPMKEFLCEYICENSAIVLRSSHLIYDLFTNITNNYNNKTKNIYIKQYQLKCKQQEITQIIHIIFDDNILSSISIFEPEIITLIYNYLFF